MNTEITDNLKHNGRLFYDADCPFCARMADHFRATLGRRHIELVPLQAPGAQERLGLSDSELLTEMRLLTPDGKVLGGADAALELGRRYWWTWPIRQLARIPAVTELFRAGYRWIASHRHCTASLCRPRAVRADSLVRAPLPAVLTRYAVDFLPLLMFPLLALFNQPHLAPWVFMWAMAFALYAGCKWLTYRTAFRACATKPHLTLVLGYLLFWPGMDARDFLCAESHPVKPCAREWIFAITKTILGIFLIWGITHLAFPAHPLLAGWIGMTGAIFILHFGSFHLVSLAWRNAGVNAVPLMKKPLTAKSLAEFWSRRWNTAFNELAFRFTFRPLRRWTSPTAAILIVFGFSGLIHELVISLPAHDGYGLPTLYFVAQGAGMIVEHSRWGRKLGLGSGVRGRIFTIIITAGPAFFLFHPPFITNVILPMLTALGAT